MGTKSRLDGSTNGHDVNGRFASGNASGSGRPRRQVESDYLRTLSDVCTRELWQGIVERAVKNATDGKAPTPLTVVVQQLNAADPLVDELAKPTLDRERYPMLHDNDEFEQSVKQLVAVELATKFSKP